MSDDDPDWRIQRSPRGTTTAERAAVVEAIRTGVPHERIAPTEHDGRCLVRRLNYHARALGHRLSTRVRPRPDGSVSVRFRALPTEGDNP
jgi:hypothetical protein